MYISKIKRKILVLAFSLISVLTGYILSASFFSGDKIVTLLASLVTYGVIITVLIKFNKVGLNRLS